MRRIALILFGVLFIAVIAFAFTVATFPRARLSIRAVGPTGKVSTNWNYLANEEVMPIWLFAITNTGGAPASWSAYERVKLPIGVPTALLEWPLSAPGGVIGPGDTRFAEMIVPADTNVVWCAFVEYQSIPRNLEQKLWNSIGGIP